MSELKPSWDLRNGGEMGELIRAFDWSRTPLGPISEWPQHLRTVVATLVECRLPMYLAWGPDQIQFYNDACLRVLGQRRHPAALGGPARLTWADQWPTLGPLLQQVSRGEAVAFDDMKFPVDVDGRVEEGHFNVSYSPVRDAQSQVAGILVTFAETTARVRSENLARADRERLHSLFMQAPVAICITRGPELRYELANPLYQRFTRKSERELLGRRVYEIFPELAPEIRAILDGVMATGERFVASELPVTLDFDVDGEFYERFFTVMYEPFRDGDGRIEGMLTFAFDVTELVVLRRRAEQAEQRSRFTLAAAEMGEWDLDVATGLAWRSLRHDQCFGHAELLPSWTYQDFVAHVRPDHRERVNALMQEALAGPGGWSFECPVVWPDGSEHWVAARSQVERDANDKPLRMSGLVWDITASRTAQAELQLASEQKDQFLATLAHELRNPLAPIRNAAHVLSAGRLEPQEQRWSAAVIERQVEHMSLLLDDLLDVSRITTGKIELRPVPTELATVIHAAVETATPALQARQHRLELALPSRPVALQADPLRLAQVLTNLLTNAIKYTDVGGLIRIEARVDDAGLVLSVSDNGIGLAPAALPSLFRMFSQVSSAVDRAEGGLGIGLALSRGLAEMHGGTLEASSAGPGQGSTFTLTLPSKLLLRSDPQAPAADARPAAEPTSGHRILIVDDNRDAADTLGMLLEMEGHQVAVAYGGEEALAVAARLQPQVAILDIGMPGMNGYQLAACLREHGGVSTPVLIAATGWGQPQDQQRALEAGFDRHLTKPLDPAHIVSLLAELEPSR